MSHLERDIINNKFGKNPQLHKEAREELAESKIEKKTGKKVKVRKMAGKMKSNHDKNHWASFYDDCAQCQTQLKNREDRKMKSKEYTNTRCGHCGKFGHHHSRHKNESGRMYESPPKNDRDLYMTPPNDFHD